MIDIVYAFNSFLSLFVYLCAGVNKKHTNHTVARHPYPNVVEVNVFMVTSKVQLEPSLNILN